MYINRYCRHFLTYGLSLGLVSIWLSCQVPTSKKPTNDTIATQQGVATVETAPTAAAIDTAIQRAFRYLAASQLEDGSWAHYTSKTKDMQVLSEVQHPHIFSTLKILLSLKNTSFEKTSIFEKGIDFIVAEKDTAYNLWSFEGRTYFYSNNPDIARIYQLKEMLKIEPDIDDSSIGLYLTSSRIGLKKEDLEAVKAIYDANKSNNMYRSFLSVYGKKAFKQQYSYANSPSLGANLMALGFLSYYKLDTRTLENAIHAYISQKNYLDIPDYYRFLPVLAQLAAESYDMGALSAMAYVRQFIQQWEDTNPIVDRLLYTELAGYIRAKSLVFQQQKQDMTAVMPYITALLKQQHANGGWIGHAYYEGGYHPEYPEAQRNLFFEYFGSDAETTAFALKALYTYRQLLP